MLQPVVVEDYVSFLELANEIKEGLFLARGQLIDLMSFQVKPLRVWRLL
jgi:hypothetical protein